jgi:quercetin dioxygenase-like cupin family protein
MKLVEKLWGQEEWIEMNDLYGMKLLKLMPGFQSSLHYHPVKDETMLVISGCCDLQVGLSEWRRMVKGDSQRLQPGVPHRFKAINEICIIVEAGTPHEDSDVVRLENSRRIE